MAVDLILAILHHVLVFGLFGMLMAEAVLVRPGLAGDTLKRLAGMDRGYGMTAGLVIVVGLARVFFGLKGWEYYLANPWFWAKMATFVVVAVLSIQPTARIARWGKAVAANSAYVVDPAEIAGVRRYLQLQLGFFVLIPAFAAAMARY